MRRREALEALASLLFLTACGPAAPPARPPEAPAGAPLHLDPATDLVAAAGLVWLADLRLRAIFGELDLIPALNIVISEEHLDRFAKDEGGVDLRQVTELAYARYPEATLAVVRGPVDPPRIERAFMERAAPLDGRGVDPAKNDAGAALVPVTRLWGTVAGERQQVAIFGRDGVALERGKLGPLRAAEAFAQGRLKRARPALRAEPLARAAEIVGEAPIRAFAPGPFEGEWANAFGGLLKACTAVAGAATPAGATARGHAKMRVKLALLGAWGDDAAKAGERVAAVYRRLGEDPFGHLCALDAPLDGPHVATSPEAVTLEVTLDALSLARGLHDVTSANVREIMSY